MSKTLILCPVYNEQYTLETFIRRLVANTGSDILFVDDGSTDNSCNIIRDSLTQIGERMYLLCHHTREGYGAALISGFQIALRHGYEQVITIDTDLQHRPEDIVRFETALATNDVVLGTRYHNSFNLSCVPRSRFLINRYISALFKKEFAFCFSDPFCGFRGYSHSFLEQIHLSERSYGVCLEMLLEIIRTGATYFELPVDMIYRDSRRQFMDGLENPLLRLEYYKGVINGKKPVHNEQSIAVNQ